MKKINDYLIFILLGLTVWVGFTAPCFAQDTTALVKIKNIRSFNETPGVSKVNEVLEITLIKPTDTSLYNHIYINDLKIKGLKKYRDGVITPEGYLLMYFKLDTPFIDPLIDSFFVKQTGSTKKFKLKIALGNEEKRHTTNFDYELQLNKNINYQWSIGISIIVLAISLYVLYKNILKDDGNLYYSLARSQLFFWSLIFIICFLYLCIDKETLPEIPNSILAILSISAGTTAIGAVVEVERKKRGQSPVDPNAKSQGWFLDIISDGSSISVQRFQNVIFNIVFSIIFIQRTISDSILPSFDENVLLLMGLSSLTYAGLKPTELSKDQRTAAAKPSDKEGTPADKKETSTGKDSPADNKEKPATKRKNDAAADTATEKEDAS